MWGASRGWAEKGFRKEKVLWVSLKRTPEEKWTWVEWVPVLLGERWGRGLKGVRGNRRIAGRGPHNGGRCHPLGPRSESVYPVRTAPSLCLSSWILFHPSEVQQSREWGNQVRLEDTVDRIGPCSCPWTRASLGNSGGPTNGWINEWMTEWLNTLKSWLRYNWDCVFLT